MILQSLVRLYERRATLEAADGQGPAPVGFEWKAIPFIIVIDRQGCFVALQDTRRDEGKKKIANNEMVPAGVKKTSGIAANLLWDTAEYVLGVETQIKNKITKPDRIREQHAAFVACLDQLPTALKSDEAVAAVMTFLSSPVEQAKLDKLELWEVIRTTNPLLSFRLQHDSELACQRPAFRDWWLTQTGADNVDGLCLVTGKPAAIERLHPAIKGVWGAQTSGANIISFNLDAFTSYGKEQGANAPVGKAAAAMYTTALNDLLRDQRHRIQVGDASTVFWAEEDEHPIEDAFAALLGSVKKDDPRASTDYVKSIYDSIRSGKLMQDRGDTKFFVLGLAPNAARLSVRFWYFATVATLVPRFKQHLDDLEIVRPPFEIETPNLFRLLLACALRHEAKNIPPNLGGEVIRAVLEDRAYPTTLFSAALRRCRAERNVDYARAAILKAYLKRQQRIRRSGEKELTVALDPDNHTPAYLLGRLFMVLERVQAEAMGEINRSIRDTYWGAAQANPRRTFPKLIDLSMKHLKKIKREKTGRAVNLEKLIEQLVGLLKPDHSFPETLAATEQGRFIIGYYHQRQHESTYKSQGSKEQ